MLIRRAEKADIEAICTVDARAFGSGPYAEARDQAGNPDWREKRSRDIAAWYRDHYPETFVAVLDDRVVGFAGYKPIEGGTGIIDNNAVDPDFQGRGISTQLVGRVVEELTSLGVTRIEVATAHVPAAVRAYEKAGFRIFETRGPRNELERTVG